MNRISREVPIQELGLPPETSEMPKDAIVRRLRRVLPFLPLLVLLTGFYLYPLARTLALSVNGADMSPAYFAEFFSTPGYRQVLVRTVTLSLGVTAACLIVGYPVAYFLATCKPAIRNVLFALVLVPWLTSELVRNYTWQVILSDNGILNQVLENVGWVDAPLSLTGQTSAVFVAMVYVQMPLTILPLYAVLSGLDLNLLRVASTLGASPIRVLLTILIPLTLPGIAAASLLVFLTALGFYITPAILGGPSDLFMANLIDIQVTRLVNLEIGSAMAVTLILVAFVVVAASARFIGLTWLTGGHHK